MLGRAKRAAATKDDTTIIHGVSEPEAIRVRVAQIRTQIAESTSDYDREKLEERHAKIAGGVAVVRVGGASELEVKERKDRVRAPHSAGRAPGDRGAGAGGDGGRVEPRRDAILEAGAASLKSRGTGCS